MSQLTINFYADQACTQPDPAGLFWRAGTSVESGADSAAVARAFLRWKTWWGGSTFKIVAWDTARPVGEADYTRDFWELPDPARSFTAEGHRDNAGVIVDVSLLQVGK